MPIAHSVYWFFTEGVYRADWFQAGLTLVSVLLNFATLAVLCVYAFDTRTLAKQTVKQVTAMEREHLENRRFRFYLSSDVFQILQFDLTRLMKAAVDSNGLPQPPIKSICPSNWPEIAVGFLGRNLAAGEAAMKLGLHLRALDSAIHDYNEADYTNRTERGQALMRALKNAVDGARDFTSAYGKTEPD
jgi:hypothetical protein